MPQGKSDEMILFYLKKYVKEYHKAIRSETIAYRILEEYAFYTDIRYSTEIGARAERFYVEAENRNLQIPLEWFKYEPDINLDDIIKVINYVRKKEIVLNEIDKERINAFFNRIIKECKKKEFDIIKENQLGSYQYKLS